MAAGSLPPPPINDKPGSFTWLEWYRQLRSYISTSGSVPWYIINFTGSNITDLATYLHNTLQGLQGGTTNEKYHLTSAENSNLTGGTPTFNSLYLNDNLILSKTSGEGIKVDVSTPTFPWRDLLGEIHIHSVGANDPSFNVYRGSLRQFEFNSVGTKEVYNSFHLPHDLVPGSNIYIHAHWSQIVVDTGGTAGVPGNVKWYFEVSYAKGHQQAAFSAPITTSVVQQGSTTQYMHNIAEVQLSATSPSASQLDSDDLEPDGLLLVRTYRTAADAADTLNQNPFLHYVDIHYQSTGIGTKQKAPNFYV